MSHLPDEWFIKYSTVYHDVSVHRFSNLLGSSASIEEIVKKVKNEGEAWFGINLDMRSYYLENASDSNFKIPLELIV